MTPADESSPAGPSTGLPVLRTWLAVYVFVLAVFVLTVVALTVLTLSYR